MREHPELPTERARNSEYLRRSSERAEIESRVSVVRSRLWVDPGGIKSSGRRGVHPLIGRLGFDATDELLGRSCYVGASRVDQGDFQVVSWDAPLAQRYFYGSLAARCVIDGALAVRRTFELELDHISDIDDEWLLPVEPSPFAAGLSVPSPATHRPASRRRTQAATPGVEPADLPDPRTPGLPATAGSFGSMRAPATVLKRLAAPRSNSIRSVLATLQPDQFTVVSHPPDSDLVVQGHPGTGKTVIAAYRSAYLVSPERLDQRASRVLLVGPTQKYVEHVRGLLRPLDPDGRVTITHVAETLDRTVALNSQWSGGIGGDHDDVDARAQRFASLAEEQLRSRTPESVSLPRRDRVRALYEILCENGGSTSLSDQPEERRWMRRLPDFDQAIRLRRYLPLIAQLVVAFEPVSRIDQFDHIIVDEAQDVSPIEWNVLRHYLRGQGRWTLVGDLNQRRSDSTYSSWASVIHHLELGLAEGIRPEPVVMERGYRATGPILRFADRVLPASQRGASSIQSDGPEPIVRHVPRFDSLIPEAVAAACRLLDGHPGGTAAIITTDTGALVDWLGRRGWRRGDMASRWRLDDLELNVLAPESARGLEFDGVVVMEPGAFPENNGRAGQLYTSLTRANRELEVVWHSNLPRGLRVARPS